MREEHYYRLLNFVEHGLKLADPQIAHILDRALDGKEIDTQECIILLKEDRPLELNLIKMTADFLRWTVCDDIVTFVVNRNINFTNICILRCKFCAFSRPVGHPEGYVLSMDDIRKKVREAISFGSTEVCVQGAINPDLDFEYYIKLLKTIKEEAPWIHIHAFSPQEVYYLSVKSGLSIEEVLKTLRESGLDTMPGTAAEILSDDVRKIICPGKISTEKWIEIIKTAHRLGIRTSATIMYGHVENFEHIANHLKIIREIQKETRGFTEFVLLPFVHYRTELAKMPECRPGSTGMFDAKLCAVSRIFLYKYVKNIQVSWVKLGRRLAQLLLSWGANDLGGTLIEENISHPAGATETTFLTPREFIYMIREAGKIPAERTTVYKILKVYR